MALQQIELLLAGVRDTSGNVLGGGKVYTYNAGTLTPKVTYVDSAGATPATNPIILDSAGRAQVYADGAFKLVVDDSSNANIYAWDNLYFARVTSAVSQWPDIYGGTSTGSASVYGITVPLTISGYTAGQEFKFIANHDTTGAAATLNVNSQGAVSLVKGPANTALAAGDIKSGDIVCVVYDSSGGGKFKITTISASVAPSPLSIDRANSRVGVNISPVYTLQVHQSGGDSTLHLTNATTGATTADGLLLVCEAGTSDALILNRENANLRLFTNNTERIRITSGGLIGVATNSPNALCHINSSGGWSANNYGKGMYVASTGATTNPAIGLSDASGTNNWAIANNNNAFLVLQMPAITDSASAPTERMRIDGGGNVGINEGNPGSYARFVSTTTVNTFSAAFLRSSASGDVGQPTLQIRKFDNNSTTSQIFAQFEINNTNTGSGRITANGASQAAFATYSDATLKENIVDLSSQYDALKNLRPVEFDYIDGSGHQIGFIAQEVQNIYPDLVGVDKQTGKLTLTGLGRNEARLIKAFQELAETVEVLEARIAALEGA